MEMWTEGRCPAGQRRETGRQMRGAGQQGHVGAGAPSAPGDGHDTATSAGRLWPSQAGAQARGPQGGRGHRLRVTPRGSGNSTSPAVEWRQETAEEAASVSQNGGPSSRPEVPGVAPWTEGLGVCRVTAHARTAPPAPHSPRLGPQGSLQAPGRGSPRSALSSLTSPGGFSGEGSLPQKGPGWRGGRCGAWSPRLREGRRGPAGEAGAGGAHRGEAYSLWRSRPRLQGAPATLTVTVAREAGV